MSESLGSAVLELEVNGSSLDRGLQQGERRTKQSMQRMTGAVRGMGRALTVGFTIPMAFAARGALEEMQQIDAQNARSQQYFAKVGDASLLSQRKVVKFAGAMQDISGIDDQLIQGAENSILWLGNLNTTTAAGAETFKVATRGVTDWAEATGKPIESLGVVMGKALAEPEKAAGKLRKAGVLLTAQQQKQIEVMVKHGKTAEAQGIIADAVARKFAGASKLTNADKWAIITDKLKGMGATLLVQLLPAFTRFTQLVTMGMAKFDALSPSMKHLVANLMLVALAAGPVMAALGALFTVVEGVGAILAFLVSPIGLAVAALGTLGVMWLRQGNHMQVFKAKLQAVAQWVRGVAFPTIIAGAKAAMDWFRGHILPTVQGVVTGLVATLTTWFTWGRAAWKEWGAGITKVVKTYFTLIRMIVETGVKVVGGVIKTVLAVLRGDWSGAWSSLKGTVSAALTGVGAILKAAGKNLLAIAKLLWATIGKGATAALKALPGLVVGLVKKGFQAIWDLSGWVLSQAKSLGGDIIDGIVAGVQAGVGALEGAVKHAALSALSAAKNVLDSHSPSRVFRDEVGLSIMQGIGAGLTLGLPGVISTMTNSLQRLRASQSAGLAALKSDSDAKVKAATEASKAAAEKLGATRKLKGDFEKIAALEKSAADRARNARDRVHRANEAVAAASKTKGKADDAHARNALKNAKDDLKLQLHAVKAAKDKLIADASDAGVNIKRLHTLKQYEAAIKAQQKVADIAEAAAKAASEQAEADATAAQAAAQAAEDAAQAAIDAVQARQDEISAGLDAIKDKASLALNTDDLQRALLGDPGARLEVLRGDFATMQQYLHDNDENLTEQAKAQGQARLAALQSQMDALSTQSNGLLSSDVEALKTEYTELQAYLAANLADLSTSAIGGLYADMASLMQQINADQAQIAAASTNPVLTSSITDGLQMKDGTISGATSGGGSGTTTPVVINQAFASTPDMFAASRSALFAYRTAGLVAG